MSLFKNMFDEHHKIERFGVIFTIFLVIFFAFNIFGVVNKLNVDSKRISSKAIYTNTFKFSQSEVTGKVINVYRSYDDKKAFILFKFNETDGVVLDANDYSVLMRSALIPGNDPHLSTAIKGSLYILGDRGYGGIYLVDAQGFKEKQVIDCILRSSTSLKDKDVKSASTYEMDASVDSNPKKKEDAASDDAFAKNNQARLGFNPGAADAIKTRILDNVDITPSELYKTFVGVPEDARQRDILTNTLKNMQLSLRKIDEYKRRLETTPFDNAYVVVPPLPKAIAGDKIIENKKTHTYYLKTDFVFPNGFNFNFNEVSLEQGYLKRLVEGKNVDYNDYLAKVLTFKANTDETEAQLSAATAIPTKWMFTNGKDITSYSDYNDDTALKSILETTEKLSQEYTNYMDLKKEYQTKQLRNLLNIDRLVQQISVSNSIKSNAVKIFN